MPQRRKRIKPRRMWAWVYEWEDGIYPDRLRFTRKDAEKGRHRADGCAIRVVIAKERKPR